MSFAWSRFTAQNAEQCDFLIRRSRELIGALEVIGGGVFRDRESLTLYFSPSATIDVVRVLQLPAERCATPDQLRVEVVAGPSDDVAWYDSTLQEFHRQMIDDYLDELAEVGMEPPEAFWDEYRAVNG